MRRLTALVALTMLAAAFGPSQAGAHVQPQAPTVTLETIPGKLTYLRRMDLPAFVEEHPAGARARDEAVAGTGARFEAAAGVAAGPAGSTFLLRFNLYGPHPNGELEAINAAAGIWSRHLASPVPIVVDVSWTSYGDYVAAAKPGYYVRNFPGSPSRGVYYPAAIANRLAGERLNPDEPDIEVLITTSEMWYYGLDGRAPRGSLDLVTVILHELAHGLGVSDSADADTELDAATGSFAGPTAYDTLLETRSGRRLVDMADPSNALGEEMLSGEVFLGGSAGQLLPSRPRVFAPPIFVSGSSLSHLDETAFPEGDPESLFTAFIASGEAVHTPGPILLAVLSDIGWGAPAARDSAYAPRAVLPGLVSGRTRYVEPEADGVPRFATIPPRPVMYAAATTAAARRVELRRATWQMDQWGVISVMGEAANVGKDPLGTIVVTIAFLARNGDELDTDLGTTVLPVLPAGADAPFYSSFDADMFDIAGDVAAVEVAVSYTGKAVGSAPAGIETRVETRTFSPLGHLHVRGIILNSSGSSWKHIVGLVALYDRDGNMVALDAALPTPARLASGSSANFDVVFPDAPEEWETSAVKTWTIADPWT